MPQCTAQCSVVCEARGQELLMSDVLKWTINDWLCDLCDE